MTDSLRQTFVKFGTVKAGDKLVTDGGFTCMGEVAKRTVMKDKDGHLYVRCGDGRHYLNGQLGRYNELVGFSKAEG